MSEQKPNNDEAEFIETLAEAADFVHDRTESLEKTALNNTVEEYVEENKGKG